MAAWRRQHATADNNYYKLHRGVIKGGEGIDPQSLNNKYKLIY